MVIAELFENEKLFKEFLENINSGVAIYETIDNGENFLVREMNRAGLEVCKVSKKDLIGKNLLDVFPNVDNFGFIATLKRVWKTGKSEHFPTSFYEDDRINGWTEMYIYRLPSKKVVTIFETQTKLVETEEKRRKTEKKFEELNKELEEKVKKRSKELEDSKEKYRKLFENSPIAIMEQDYSEVKSYIDKLKSSGITDFEKFIDENPKEVIKLMTMGKVIDVNRKTLELYKANNKEEFISRANHLSDIIDKNITDEVLSYNKKEYLALMEGETFYESKLASKTFTEDTIYLYAKTSILPGFEDTWTKVVVTLIDITDQKNIEEALQKSENEKSVILECLSEHIVYQTPDNTIIYANKAAADSVNLTPEQLIGRKCFQVWNTLDEPCEGCPVIEALKTNKPAFNEMNTPDGRVWSVAGYPVRDKDNNIIALVESTLEITEKKTAEEKVKKSEEKYRKAYYQANLYRDIFAHDINNILQNISSSVELSSLYLNNPEKLHTIKELYEIVDEQVNRAKKLISNVRKITEIDETEIILEKVDANHALNKAIEFIESSFQTRNITVDLNTPKKKNYVYANNLLLDVFENILINAVRYNNRSNIEIIINISKEQREDKNYLKMEFKDNGVGISDYRKKTIFERGSRKSQKSKGMGLGLSLVKKIMDIYHGDIWVEDRVEGDYKQGSNFIILIPSES